MKNRAYTSLLMVMMFIFYGCRKDETRSHLIDIPIDSNVKSMIFKPGSYWVYKNLQNNLFDTISVRQIGSSTLINPPCTQLNRGCTSFRYFAYSVEMNSTLAGWSSWFYYQRSTIYSDLKPTEFWFEGTPEFFNAQQNTDNIEYLQHYDSLQIHDSTYFSVDKIRVTNSLIGGNNAIMYWATGRGLIKFEKENSETWELINGYFIGN